MDNPPVLGPHQKPDEAQFIRLARRLLRELAKHDREMAAKLRMQGLGLEG
jgi:hypothetical protein